MSFEQARNAYRLLLLLFRVLCRRIYVSFSLNCKKKTNFPLTSYPLCRAMYHLHKDRCEYDIVIKTIFQIFTMSAP